MTRKLKILTDTNILISAVWSKNSLIAKLLIFIADNHKLYLTTQNITEFKEAVHRKMPQKQAEITTLLSKLSYKEISTSSHTHRIIRDATDQPILNAAIKHKLDIIITGDKDFIALNLKKPKCLTPSQFISDYDLGLLLNKYRTY